ncbi:ATP-dependent DNA helicase [Alteromonas sp. BMJM2]|uniref:ATP-dependent DNA helicase n=1 Tax=Alteromonas sp. BMJM2 TaxID=2954241 RepID=UPI0022B4BEE7|nr:AAA family ATPase [Alteromonas sp. BMJM2]
MAFTLNDCQSKAVIEITKFLLDPEADEMVLEGYAGTGKTTLIAHYLENFDKYKQAHEVLGAQFRDFDEIAITATTRKAARVLSETMEIEPMTIHAYLKLIMKNNWSNGTTSLIKSKAAEVLENKLIIIDEASFIDSSLKGFINLLTMNCKIIYMGDPAQLISVNESKSPIFDAGIKTVRLNTIMRNKGTISKIAKAYRETVHTGQFKPLIHDGLSVKHVEPDEFEEQIRHVFTHPGFQPERTAKVLAWTNNRVSAYNSFIRYCRNVPDHINEGETLITNKPIMESTSDYISYSTDVPVTVKNVEQVNIDGIEGFLVDLEKRKELFVPTERWKVKALLRKFADAKQWKQYFHVKDQWGDLRPVYSSTVHKSQGSTYDKVFIDLSDIGSCKNPDDVARLLYVAVSRASTEVIMCGQLPPEYLGETNNDSAAAKLKGLKETLLES